MTDATSVGTAIAVGAALVIRAATIAGRSNRRAGRQAKGRQVRRPARARAAPPPVPQYRPPPQNAPDSVRSLSSVRSSMAAQLSTPPAAPAPPADAVTFEQLVERARWAVVDRQDASTGFVAQELGVGREQAERVLAVLEQRGVVGPATLSLMPRQVLVPRGQ